MPEFRIYRRAKPEWKTIPLGARYDSIHYDYWRRKLIENDEDDSIEVTFVFVDKTQAFNWALEGAEDRCKHYGDACAMITDENDTIICTVTRKIEVHFVS